MERQKVRDTDNVRLFFLAHFFIEYLLILYKRDQVEKGKEGEAGADGGAERILLGYAVIMVEMDSVKWVFSRMRMTMEDKVSCESDETLGTC
jgi:replication fork protection complex subunit Tof1/Swi1